MRFVRFQAVAASFVTVSLGFAAGGHGKVDGLEIRWTSADIELVGTLVLPEGEGPHPLTVFVPGSGCLPKLRSHRLVREHVKHLTELGMAMFVYDKRGCDESGGDWRQVGIEELADDVLAVLPQLAADPAIDPKRIGVMGLSQGGWISLIAAGKSNDIAFIIMLSGTPLTPAEQGTAMVEMRMASRGWDEASIERALELDRTILEVYRTDSGWEDAEAAIAAVSTEPWFEDSGVGIQSRDLWNWQWLRTFMDYDPIPAIRDLAIPILAIFGEHDTLVPAKRSQRIFDELSASAGGRRHTHLLPGVRHDLRPGKGKPWPDEYWQTLEAWFVDIDLLELQNKRP